MAQNQLETPDALLSLTALQALDLSHNALKSLPEAFSDLVDLRFLDLRFNALEYLPPHFFKLKQLQQLYLGHNPLVELPEDIHQSEQLQMLDISNTKLKKLPVNLSLLQYLKQLDWEGENNITSLESPPQEILRRGLEDTLYFLSELKWQGATKLFETKLLIVGEPDAGKTTLKRRLINADAPMPDESETTKGIDISQYTFKTAGEYPFRVNIWDFGGQAIYQSTHQFFLTHRSLYVLVLDTRKDDDKLDYWLQTLELFAGDSPIIIVQNQKAGRTFPLNGQAIRARFPNVCDILAADLLDSNAIAPIAQAIKEQAQQLPHVGTELPLAWIKVRRELEAMAQGDQPRHYIDWKDFVAICVKNGLPDLQSAQTLSRYLHDLGVFLHFAEDKVLKRTIFLQNAWVTAAIYKLLDDDLVKNRQKGRFSMSDLDRVWQDSAHAELRDELLELMLKFELCYPLQEDDQFIIPQLLPAEQPPFAWEMQRNLVVRYRYDFMPRGIFTKLLVNVYRYIADQNLVWKEGALLQRLQAKAKVIENYRDREIVLRVQGEGAMDFLTILLEELDGIHQHYQQLQVEKLIPCICSTCQKADKPFFYEYEKLQRRLQKQKETIECEESFEEVNIHDLMHGVEPEKSISGGGAGEVRPEPTKIETIKVLFLAANPKDTQALDLPKEVRELMQALQMSRMREQIELVQHWAVTFDDLQQALTDEMPQIVHFSGHGQSEGILLESAEGYSQVATTKVLEKLFSLYKDSVRCIILNACYSETQAKALAQHIPFVIGVNTALMDQAAMAFTLGFYRGLGGRLDIKFAYNSGIVRVESNFGDAHSRTIELWENGNALRGA